MLFPKFYLTDKLALPVTAYVGNSQHHFFIANHPIPLNRRCYIHPVKYDASLRRTQKFYALTWRHSQVSEKCRMVCPVCVRKGEIRIFLPAHISIGNTGRIHKKLKQLRRAGGKR